MVRNKISALITDDNRDLADGLALILEDEGCQVRTCYNGEDALQELLTNGYDVAFVDIKLPGLSGIDVCRVYYKHNTFTRIILMTGYRIDQILGEISGNNSVSIIRDVTSMDQVMNRIAEKNAVSLLIDGDGNVVNKMRGATRAKGNHSVVVDDANAAWDALKEEVADVVFLMLNKPIVIEMGVYFELKNNFGDLPHFVFAINHDNQASAMDPLKDLHVTGCLFKPFRPGQLLDAIAGLR